jgi:putative ABC transport system substrate-binding protein
LHKIALTLLIVMAFAGFGEEPAQGAESLIVVVQAKATKPYEEVLDGFSTSLKAKGIKAQFDVHTLEGDIGQIDRILEDAAEKDADLILTVGTAVTEYVVKKDPDIPIVYSLVLEMVGTDRIDVTGVTLNFLLSSHFEWMRRFLPKARRIGVLYNPENNSKRIKQAIKRAAESGFVLVAEAVEKPQDLPAALERIAKEADVLWGIPDDVVLNPQTAKQLLLFCYRNKIPFIGPSKAWVKAGALYALDRDYNDIGTQCADIASLILQGSASEPPRPQSPKKITYYVNMKTAKHMKVDIGKQLLARADGVY